jgi:hypothetical protein
MRGHEFMKQPKLCQTSDTAALKNEIARFSCAMEDIGAPWNAQHQPLLDARAFETMGTADSDTGALSTV